MTDLDLQRAIHEELEQHLLHDGIMMIRGKTFQNMHVFDDSLPLKEDGDEDEDDEKQWNYIAVVLGDEDVVTVNDEEMWRVQVHFSIGIEDLDQECQGKKNIAYIMNEIYLHFTQHAFIGQPAQYQMEVEAHKRFNDENVYPYYEGDLITSWLLPLPLPEGLEEFL